MRLQGTDTTQYDFGAMSVAERLTAAGNAMCVYTLMAILGHLLAALGEEREMACHNGPLNPRAHEATPRTIKVMAPF